MPRAPDKVWILFFKFPLLVYVLLLYTSCSTQQALMTRLVGFGINFGVSGLRLGKLQWHKIIRNLGVAKFLIPSGVVLLVWTSPDDPSGEVWDPFWRLLAPFGEAPVAQNN